MGRFVGEENEVQKFALRSQIDEINRELKMRSEVYPRAVAKGTMRHSDSLYWTARLRAVRESLQYLEQLMDDEETLRKFTAEAAKRRASRAA